MGRISFIILAIIFLFFLVKNSGYTRLLWFFTGTIFFQDRIVLFESTTLITFPRLLIYTLILIALVNPGRTLTKLRHFPLIKPLFLVLFGTICIALFDFRHNSFLNLYRSLDDFIQSFLIILLCYLNFTSTIQWEKLVRSLLLLSLILGIYGIIV